MGKLSAHIVVALVALVAIGGATRIMEAGLACPDWPLCYGSFFPMGRMNVQVFLEWFHRLDACFIGIAIFVQLCFSLVYRSFLPRWLPWINGCIFLLVVMQGALGALTVIDLLPSLVVMAHLFLALTLVALMSGVTQRLLAFDGIEPPFWWKFFSTCSLLAVVSQSLLGSRMATMWIGQRCLLYGLECQWLDLHRSLALPVCLGVFIFAMTSILLGGWYRDQWPFLIFIVFLLGIQIVLGFLSVHLVLAEPFIRVSHQLVACLLVASLSAISWRKRILPLSQLTSSNCKDTSLEVCHG